MILFPHVIFLSLMQERYVFLNSLQTKAANINCPVPKKERQSPRTSLGRSWIVEEFPGAGWRCEASSILVRVESIRLLCRGGGSWSSILV